MNGWHGYIIRVDLSRSSAVKEKLSEELLVNYLGGRGLGARLLRESCTWIRLPLTCRLFLLPGH
jgi:aldehyde:ferredoxin oxidoreductase